MLSVEGLELSEQSEQLERFATEIMPVLKKNYQARFGTKTKHSHCNKYYYSTKFTMIKVRDNMKKLYF